MRLHLFAVIEHVAAHQAGITDVQARGWLLRKPRPRQPASGVGAGKQQAGGGGAVRDLQRHAWQWALTHRAEDGSLPSGREIARRYGRHERWGRLVKRAGIAGEFAAVPGLRLLEQPPQPRVDDRSIHRQ